MEQYFELDLELEITIEDIQTSTEKSEVIEWELF